MLQEKAIGITLASWLIAGAVGGSRAVLQEVDAELADLLHRRIVIALGIQQEAEVLAYLVGRTEAGGVMAVGRTGLSRNVMGATIEHFLIVAAAA